MTLTKTRPAVPGLAFTVILAAVLVPVTDVAGTAGSLGTPLPATPAAPLRVGVAPRVFHVRASGTLREERLAEESYLKQLTLPSSWTTTTWP